MEILFVKKNPLQDLLSSLNAIISTNESSEFIAGHVIYKPNYTYKNQLKTTFVTVKSTGIPFVHFAGIQQVWAFTEIAVKLNVNKSFVKECILC